MFEPCSSETRTILRDFLSDECLLTVKNQKTLCCYWNITEDCLSTVALQTEAGEEVKEAIRLTWPAQTLFDSNYLILPTSFASCHKHLDVPFPDQAYQVEIGWIRPQGDFISILTSNASCIH